MERIAVLFLMLFAFHVGVNKADDLERFIEILIRYASNPYGIPEAGIVEGNTNVCMFEFEVSTKYYTSCGLWGWSRCSRYRKTLIRLPYCCDGWSPYWDDLTACKRAVCDSMIEGTCTKTYSNDYIKYRTGVTQRVSGGSCTAPDTCTSCNDGFYGDGPYCSICPVISNCNHRKCSSVSDNICEYCYGEVKPKKYWRAYTSAPNAKATCEQACSWRSDSTRCYPGTCSDETTVNCVCSEGFSGYQCDTMTEEASIVYNEATLTRAVGQADVTLLNPPDPNSGAPQDTVWTNQGEWDKVQAKWDAKYDVVVPAPGGDHYITDFKHGIILAKTKFTHKRARTTIKTTDYTFPSGSQQAPINTMNSDKTFVLADYGFSTPFIHDDQLIFSVQADLGGIGSTWTEKQTPTNNGP